MARLNDTTINGNLTVAGKVTAESYNALSDMRLKTNIKPFSPSNSILELNLYAYDFIEGGGHSIGCLAHELQQICPEIVNECPDGYLSIQESKIVYLLLNEVKKLRQELDELRMGVARGSL